MAIPTSATIKRPRSLASSAGLSFRNTWRNLKETWNIDSPYDITIEQEEVEQSAEDWLKESRRLQYHGLVKLPGCQTSNGVIYYPLSQSSVVPARVTTADADSTPADEAPTLMLQCACCSNLDAVPAPFRNAKEHPDDIDYEHDYLAWRRACRRMTTTHRVKEAPEQPKPSRFHILCDACHSVCSASRVLAREPVKWVGAATKREVFRHYDSPALLKTSAENGCHLCTLMWSSLSPDQQSMVLQEDVRVRAHFDQEWNSAPTTAQQNDIKHRYERSRCVRLAIESLEFAGSTTDIVSHPWKERARAQLIPHFGGYMRPRKWMPCVNGFDGLVFDEGDRFAASLSLVMPGTRRDGTFLDARPWIWSTSTGSESAMNFVRTHLQLSMERRSFDFMPSRLIDVSRYIDQGTVRICHRGEILQALGTIPPYVALSHCWGETEFLTLDDVTKEFLLEVDVDAAIYSQNFQDTFSTTCRVGLQYVWIDSLCIIQRNSEDLKNELPLMCEIYRNAAFTIVAAAARASVEGFFREQRPLTQAGCAVTTSVRGNGGIDDMGDAFWYAMPSQKGNVEREKQVEIELSTWNQRGWCLQERALSPVVVYFCQSQIHIQTTDIGRVTPTYGPGVDTTGLPSVYDMNKKPLVTSQFDWMYDFGYTAYDQTVSAEQVLLRLEPSRWWRCIYWCTQRSFKYKSDRANGIDGLATLFQEQGSRMKVGDWLSSFGPRQIESLLWYVDHIQGPTDESRGKWPAWSWLSPNGVIANDSAGSVDGSRAGLEFLGFDHRPSNIDEAERTSSQFTFTLPTGTGMVLAGRMTTASCKTILNQFYIARSAALTTHYGGYASHPSEKISQARQRYFDKSLQQVCADPEMGPACHTIVCGCGAEVGWIVPDTHEALPTELYFLRIMVSQRHVTNRSSKNVQSYVRAARGLALKKSTRSALEHQFGVFERVGYIELKVDVEAGRKWQPIEIDTKRDVEKYKALLARPDPGDGDLDPHGFFDSREGAFDAEIVLV